MNSVHREFLDGVLVIEIIDHGDGTGIRVEYDSNGDEISRQVVEDLPLPPTAQQTLTAQLDAMSQAQAAPISIVLTAIAQLTPEQAAALVPALLTLTQGDPQGDPQ